MLRTTNLMVFLLPKTYPFLFKDFVLLSIRILVHQHYERPSKVTAYLYSILLSEHYSAKIKLIVTGTVHSQCANLFFKVPLTKVCKCFSLMVPWSTLSTFVLIFCDYWCNFISFLWYLKRTTVKFTGLIPKALFSK